MDAGRITVDSILYELPYPRILASPLEPCRPATHISQFFIRNNLLYPVMSSRQKSPKRRYGISTSDQVTDDVVVTRKIFKPGCTYTHGTSHRRMQLQISHVSTSSYATHHN